MRGTTTNANGQNATGAGSKLSNDDHRHGLYALSPLALLVLTVICALAYYLFSQLQITSTEQSVFALLQITIQLPPNLTADQAIQYMNGNLSHYQTIAAAIGWGVQIALLMLSFPPDNALLSLHKKYNTTPSPSLAKSASTLAKVRKFLMVVLVGGDIATDFLYVVQGHTLFVMDGWMPKVTAGNAGVVLVGILYPAAICFITIFVGKYLFAFVDALFEQFQSASR